jgi:plastocyanin
MLRTPHRAAAAAALLISAHVALAPPAVAVPLSGTVQLLEQGKPSAEVAAAIVYFVPEGGARPAAPATAEIMTRNRRFLPRTLVVSPGSTVRFPNDDAITHNVFSVSPGNRFDLGRYGRGGGRSQRLDTPGIVRVFCNVHRDMAAFVLVLETPFVTHPEPDGRFVLEVPAGAGVLHVWHPRAEAWSGPVRVPAADSIQVSLEATLPAVPGHLDKFGKPYREDRDGSYR